MATANSNGRSHHAAAFTCLSAGAGVKGGTVYGQTDEYGIQIVSGPVHVHDDYATILHLMGIDHVHLSDRHEFPADGRAAHEILDCTRLEFSPFTLTTF